MKNITIKKASLIILLAMGSTQIMPYNLVNAITENASIEENTQKITLDIPDFKFKEELIKKISSYRPELPKNLGNYDPSKELFTTDIPALEKITVLNFFNSTITDFKGIKYLKNLQELQFINGNLANIDISENKNLKILKIDNSKLQSININGADSLEQLFLWENNLTNLDTSSNLKLKTLAVPRNKLTKINISNNENLEILVLGAEENETNSIKDLDITKNIKLKEIQGDNCKLENVSILPNTIRKVSLKNNLLTNGDFIKTAINLNKLNLSNNKIKNIDLSTNTQLKDFRISDNMLEKLDVRLNSNLEWLDCKNNKLTSLDLSNNNKLQYSTGIEYLSPQNTEGYIEKKDDKWILDLKNFMRLEEISNITNLSSGNLNTQSGEIVFNEKPIAISYDYKTGKNYEGKPHINLGFMKNVNISLKEKETNQSEEKVSVLVQYKDIDINKSVKLQKEENIVGQKLKINLPDGYKLTDDYEIPIVNKSTKFYIVKVKKEEKNEHKDEVNKEELKKLLELTKTKMEEKDYEEKYTEDSKLNLKLQYDYAKIVYEDVNSDQYSVDSQTKALNHFLKALKEKKKEEKQEVLNIPDRNFRKLIYDKLNRRSDPNYPLKEGSIPKFEDFNLYTKDKEILSKVLELDISENGIADLTGIEYFESLGKLTCENTPELKRVDLSKNKYITHLNVRNCSIEEIITSDGNIEYLKADNNNIKAIDITKNKNLRELSLENNKLEKIDLNNNSEFKILRLGNNKLEKINVKNLKKLKTLYIENNDIKELDLSNNEELFGLSAFNTGLEKVIFRNNDQLETALLDQNKLREIDLRGLKNLKNLDIKNNELKDIDLVDNKNLTKLYDKELLSPQKIEIEIKSRRNEKTIKIDLKDLLGESYKKVNSADNGKFNKDKGIIEINKNSLENISYEIATGNPELPKMKVILEIKIKEISPSTGNSNGKVPVNNKVDNNEIDEKNNSKNEEDHINKLEFKDLDKKHWAKKYIDKLVELKIIQGYSDGTFKPENNITRAEFVKVLIKALKLEKTSGKEFEDTKNHWAKNYLSTAYNEGIIKGRDKDRFYPDENITREEMATMIMRALNKKDINNDENPFSDENEISDWAKEYVMKAKRLKILNGYQDGSFKPHKFAKRSEVVKTIFEFLKNIDK